MLKNNPQYDELCTLRDALVKIPYIEQQIAETAKAKNAIRPPERYHPYYSHYHVQKLKEKLSCQTITPKDQAKKEQFASEIRALNERIKYAFGQERKIKKLEAKKWKILDKEKKLMAKYAIFDDLENLPEYRAAEELDKRSNESNQKAAEYRYQQEEKAYQEQLTPYNRAISEYNGLIAKCREIINRCDLLHSSQKTVACVDNILYYFESRRATTVKEALNLYIEDQKHIALMDSLNTMQRNIIVTMQNEIRAFSAQMDRQHTELMQDIDKVNRALATQNKILEKARQDSNRNADRIVSAQHATSNELNSIYHEVRKLNK